MTPRVGGEAHSFAEHGLYDGLFLMRDEESGTFWDHLTGRAVYGPLVGETLPVGPLTQTTVRRALQTHPETLVALSGRARRSDVQLGVGGLLAGVRGRLSRLFQSTIAREDSRRPTMDLGLGVWTDVEARYYPLDAVRAAGRALVDTLSGAQVLVYVDPVTFVLAAVHVDGADPRWEGEVLRLSNGTTVERGIVYHVDGSRSEREPPLQVFTRWYGFSLTFPGTEIYGAND